MTMPPMSMYFWPKRRVRALAAAVLVFLPVFLAVHWTVGAFKTLRGGCRAVQCLVTGDPWTF